MGFALCLRFVDVLGGVEEVEQDDQRYENDAGDQGGDGAGVQGDEQGDAADEGKGVGDLPQGTSACRGSWR